MNLIGKFKAMKRACLVAGLVTSHLDGEQTYLYRIIA